MVTNNGLHIELTDLLPSLCCPNVIRQISDLRLKVCYRFLSNDLVIFLGSCEG